MIDAAATEPVQTTAPAGQPVAVPGSVTQRVDPVNEPAANSPDWIKDWAPEDIGVVEKKAWKSPQDMFKSYRELEKLMGQDKVVLPKDGADASEWDAVYGKLGRPDTADKYTPPKDSDPGMFKALAPGLHAAGLNQKQVDKIAEGWNQYVQKITDEQYKAAQADVEQAQQKLENGIWKANLDREKAMNERALLAFGITKEQGAEYMMKGAEKFLLLLNAAGHAVAEDSSAILDGDSTTAAFGLTPARAAAELAELRSNKDFMDRWSKKEPNAVAKYNRLNGIAAEAGLIRNTVRSNFKRNFVPT